MVQNDSNASSEPDLSSFIELLRSNDPNHQLLLSLRGDSAQRVLDTLQLVCV
jgi:hypothetical protein